MCQVICEPFKKQLKVPFFGSPTTNVAPQLGLDPQQPMQNAIASRITNLVSLLVNFHVSLISTN